MVAWEVTRCSNKDRSLSVVAFAYLCHLPSEEFIGTGFGSWREKSPWGILHRICHGLPER